MSTERKTQTSPGDRPERRRDAAWDHEFLSQAVDASIRAALRRADDARRSEPVERTRNGLSTA